MCVYTYTKLSFVHTNQNVINKSPLGKKSFRINKLVSTAGRYLVLIFGQIVIKMKCASQHRESNRLRFRA